MSRESKGRLAFVAFQLSKLKISRKPAKDGQYAAASRYAGGHRVLHHGWHVAKASLDAATPGKRPKIGQNSH